MKCMDKKMDKLSRENAIALASGTSYGKWKAKQPIVTPSQRSAHDVFDVCKHCGKTFKRLTRCKRMYCGDRCQYNAKMEREKQRKAEVDHDSRKST